jgi:RNA polymerase sigma factor (sigma-70 family)
MSRRSSRRVPPLTVIADGQSFLPNGAHRPTESGGDWSVLMARAQSGDSVAYRRLLEEIAPYLRSLAAKRHRDVSDVEDTVQDILLTLHATRHTYDPNRPFGSWLVTIANRRIIDRLRRQTRLRKSSEPFLESGCETFSSPEANFQETRLECHALQNALQRLPPKQREAIQLLKLEEMSLKQAASVSGISVASLKVGTHRALKNLRKMFAKQSGSM